MQFSETPLLLEVSSELGNPTLHQQQHEIPATWWGTFPFSAPHWQYFKQPPEQKQSKSFLIKYLAARSNQTSWKQTLDWLHQTNFPGLQVSEKAQLFYHSGEPWSGHAWPQPTPTWHFSLLHSEVQCLLLNSQCSFQLNGENDKWDMSCYQCNYGEHCVSSSKVRSTDEVQSCCCYGSHRWQSQGHRALPVSKTIKSLLDPI